MKRMIWVPVLLCLAGEILTAADGESLLEKHGIGRDAESITAYFRKLQESEMNAYEVSIFLGQLKSADFAERQRATEELLKTPESHLGLLKRAAAEGDAETRIRAGKILEEIERSKTSSEVEALNREVLGVIVRDEIKGLATPLIWACPLIRSKREWRAAFRATVTEEDPQLLRNSLGEDSATVRRACAEIIIERGDAVGLGRMKLLLGDADTSLRLFVAMHFLNAGERKALPSLAGLLVSPEVGKRLVASRILRQVTGEDFGFDPYEPDEIAIKAWVDWVRANGDDCELALPISLLPSRDDLVLHLACDVGDKVLDSSPEENHGEVRGAEFEEDGRVGGGFYLDGKKGHLRVPNSPALEVEDAVTVAAWVKLESFGPAGYGNEHGYIVNKGNAMWWNPAFCLGFSKRPGGGRKAKWPGNDGPLTPLFIVAGKAPVRGTGARVGTKTHLIAKGVWHHLVGTYDGKTAKLYVDGELAGETEYAGKIRKDKAPVVIGGARLGSVEFGGHFVTNGRVDDIRIYRRALEAGEVAMLHAWDG